MYRHVRRGNARLHAHAHTHSNAGRQAGAKYWRDRGERFSQEMHAAQRNVEAVNMIDNLLRSPQHAAVTKVSTRLDQQLELLKDLEVDGKDERRIGQVKENVKNLRVTLHDLKELEQLREQRVGSAARTTSGPDEVGSWGSWLAEWGTGRGCHAGLDGGIAARTTTHTCKHTRKHIPQAHNILLPLQASQPVTKRGWAVWHHTAS